MRPTILIISFLIVAELAVGCTPTGGNAAEGPIQVEPASPERDKVKTETKEAVQAMQDYTRAQKTKLVAETQKELAEIQTELDRLAAEVDRSKGETKADAEIKLDEVRGKWAGVKTQLEQAETATEAAWNDAKRGLQKSRDELKESFENSRQWLSDKIEP
jgi:exonuclease VII large subunit